MKKFIAASVAVLMCVSVFAGCNKSTPHTEHDYKYEYIDENVHKKTCNGCSLNETEAHDLSYEPIDENCHKITCNLCDGLQVSKAHFYDSDADLVCNYCGYTRDWLTALPADTLSNLSADGYVKDKISDFSQYVGTPAYRTVTTADELIQAIMDARWQYTNTWNSETSKVDQTLTAEGSVHVIEIANDLDLGFNHISANYRAETEDKSHSYVESFCRGKSGNVSKFQMSEMYTEHGISKIKIENTNDLLIYSKNGAKLTHAGFSVLSCDNVVFRNLEMDEMWQWEDSASSSTGKVGDYDAFGWAYFKVSHCGYVWIDHCTFGKSYDGQIDYSNPVYDTKGTAFRAPYGADGSNGLHISWCKFNAGSDDPDGYLYKMMAKIEEEYQAYKAGGANNYMYYNALRERYSFEQILYGVAIPQKKGFLCGDSGNGHSDYDMNLRLQISFSNCYFKNLEDRLPKLRGGNAVMYNCVVDSLQYITYRNQLSSAASYVTSVNSSWKCALVSQGIVCGNSGSFYGENCIYRGINTLLKNNDSGGSSNLYADDGKTVIGTTSRPAAGGYKLVDCTYQRDGNSAPTSVFSDASNLTAANFKWNTTDGNAPFDIKACGLSSLEAVLGNERYGAGVTTEMKERLLKSKYGA